MCVPLILLTGSSSGSPIISTEPGKMNKVLFFPSNGSVAQTRLAPSQQQWRGTMEGKQLDVMLPIQVPIQGTQEWCWVSLFSSVFHWLRVWVGISLRRWLGMEMRMYKSYQHRILDAQIVQTSASSRFLFVCLFVFWQTAGQKEKNGEQYSHLLKWSYLCVKEIGLSLNMLTV